MPEKRGRVKRTLRIVQMSKWLCWLLPHKPISVGYSGSATPDLGGAMISKNAVDVKESGRKILASYSGVCSEACSKRSSNLNND